MAPGSAVRGARSRPGSWLRRAVWALVLAASPFVAACGDTDPEPAVDAPSAATPDAVTPDAAGQHDAAMDSTAAPLDASGADATADHDAALPDAGPDALADTGDTDEPAGDAHTGDAPDAVAPGDTHDGDAGDADASAPGPWRSALYPDDWTPAFEDAEGRFLHDFSYAGYRNGEALAQDVPEAIFDVVALYGADPTGAQDATLAVQAAIDAAAQAGGGVVLLPEGLYRFDGVLIVAASRVVLRGEGSTKTRLWFTRTDGMAYGAHIRFGSTPGSDLEATLLEDAPSRQSEVLVQDARGLAPGDDVALGWVITPEFIDEHDMTGTWEAFNGTWQPFLRRQVVAVDTTVTPHRVVLDVPLRYPALVRDTASLRRETGLLRECGVEALGLSNAAPWDDAWAQMQVHALELLGVVDCWVRDVASFATPGDYPSGSGAPAHLQSSGILVRHAKRVTIADTSLGWSQNRGSGGCGYLFEVRQSSEILYRDCVATAGRHNFIQNWGFGATGIVWLRVHTALGATMFAKDFFELQGVGLSEFHHSLATANLIDASTVDDGWGAENRRDWSTGAGQTSTQTVFWNVAGAGRVESHQWGWGYVVGTAPTIKVHTGLEVLEAEGTAPEDLVEGAGQGALLVPQSLYEDQRARRLATPAP